MVSPSHSLSDPHTLPGQMDGWVEGLVGEWVEGFVGKLLEKWVDRCLNCWLDGRRDGWVEESEDGGGDKLVVRCEVYFLSLEEDFKFFNFGEVIFFKVDLVTDRFVNGGLVDGGFVEGGLINLKCVKEGLREYE